MSFRLLIFAGGFLASTSASAFVSQLGPKSPRLVVELPASFRSCLKDTVNQGGPIEQDARWQWTCDPEVFFQQQKELNLQQPALRLLLGRLAGQQLTHLRTELPVQAELFVPWTTHSEYFLRPLWDSESPSVLAREAALEHFRNLGLAQKFTDAFLLLAEPNISKLLAPSFYHNQVVDLAELWVAQESAAPAKQFLDKRPIKGDPEADLLQITRTAKEAAHLPLKDFQKEIRRLVKNVETEKAREAFEFFLKRSWGRRFLNQLSSEDRQIIWELFQTSVRVLRILDQREKIPAHQERWVRAFGWTSPLLAKDDPKTFLEYGLQLARFDWNYDDPERALKRVNALIAFTRRLKSPQNLPELLGLKARILEQSPDRTQALEAMDEALAQKGLPAELHRDLAWRRFFLEWDVVEAELGFAKLKTRLGFLRKFSKEPAELGQWNWWAAQVLYRAGHKSEAKDALKNAYEADPFGFYSNLAGLQLIEWFGDAPPGWLANAQDHWNGSKSLPVPDWSLFFDQETGKPSRDRFRDLTRANLLGSIGDVSGALRALKDSETDLWPFVLSKKESATDRRRYSRALSYLRLSLGDVLGSLRAAEVSRQAFGADLESEDFAYLYPRPFWQNLTQEAHRNKIDPVIVAALIRQESAFDPRAKSSANALGLMQMIPPVAQSEARLVSVKQFHHEDLYTPAVALKLGVHHLAGLARQFEGSEICATAAYNAGTPPVDKWLDLNYRLNPSGMVFIERISFIETRNYVKAILRNYMNYRRIYSEPLPSFAELTSMPEKLPGIAWNPSLNTRPF